MRMDRAIASMAAGFACSSGLGQTCAPMWSTEFADGHLQWKVYALTSFDDDGSGPLPPALYAGGLIFETPASPFKYVGRWKVDGWEPLGQGVDDEVHALHVHDDGTGEALFVGGMFQSAGGTEANRIGKWNGAAWFPVGLGFTGGNYPTVRSLETFDEDGPGPQAPRLFAGGHFSHADGVLVNGIARWDGSQWSEVGGGVTGGPIDTKAVAAMIVHDDGTGPALYVGGLFDGAGGQMSPCVARWTGSQWQPLGSGFPVAGNQGVLDFAVFDPDDSGPMAAMVHAGGYLVSTTILNLGNLARWTGTEWESIAGPAPASAGVQHPVEALQVWDDDGVGPNDAALFVAGRFTNIWPVTPSTIPYRRIAKWTGESWEQLAGGINTSDAFDLMVFDPDGPGAATERLLVAGEFTRVGDATVRAEGIAQWSGADWSPLGRGLNDITRALLRTDPDGLGPMPMSVVAGGSFTHAAQTRVNGVAVRTGGSWHTLGAGFDGPVYALAEHDADGPGGLPAVLVAGGDFMHTSGVPAARLAAWNGVTWQEIGGGMPEPSGGGVSYRVYAAESFDEDGPGPAPPTLYAGGLFNLAGSTAVKSLARWNGASWSDVGGGVAFSLGWGTVRAMLTFDDGTGTALYVGGAFSLAGGQSISRIGRWNGTSWSPLATGMNAGGESSAVRALAAFDDGTGNALYAGGTFTTAGGVICNRIARWDGQLWTAVGAGISGQAVNALAGMDPDGPGPLPSSLFVGGEFTGAGGVSAIDLAWWNGATWTAAATGADASEVLALLADAYDGPSLYAAGAFYGIDGVSSGCIARRVCPSQPCYPDCNTDGALTVADFACFQTAFVTGNMYADCNQSGTLTVQDFGCFQTKFVAGCP